MEALQGAVDYRQYDASPFVERCGSLPLVQENSSASAEGAPTAAAPAASGTLGALGAGAGGEAAEEKVPAKAAATLGEESKGSPSAEQEPMDTTEQEPKAPETDRDRLVKDAQLSTAAAAALGAAAVKAKVGAAACVWEGLVGS